jgi:hypothetical protein
MQWDEPGGVGAGTPVAEIADIARDREIGKTNLTTDEHG